MYHRLCNKLALDTAGAVGHSPEYSQAVAMNDGNAVQWEAVLFHLDRGGVFFRSQASNDLEEWSDVGSDQNSPLSGAASSHLGGSAWPARSVPARPTDRVFSRYPTGAWSIPLA